MTGSCDYYTMYALPRWEGEGGSVRASTGILESVDPSRLNYNAPERVAQAPAEVAYVPCDPVEPVNLGIERADLRRNLSVIR
jgi:hypothetical protein